MDPYLQTLLTAMMPIAELRLAIPLALGALHLPLGTAYVLSVIGNMIPIVPLLLFLDKVSGWLSSRYALCRRFFEWLFNRTRRRITGRFEIYGYIALVIFVAIPLPLTGAWSGAAAAYLLGIPFWRALALILAGVLLAGVLVSLTALGVLALF